MKFFSGLKQTAINFLEPYKTKGPATFSAAQQAVGGLLILDGFIGIDNPFGGKKRPGIFGTLSGVVLGVLFILIPTFFGSILGLNAMTATTSAIVVDVNASTDSNGSRSCLMTAKYTVDGKEYIQQSSIGSSSQCGLTGASITINYDPNNPGAWAYDIESVKLIVKVFFWAGIAVLVSSLFTFLIRLLSIIFGWKILRSGRALAATLPQDTNLSTMINEIKQSFVSTLFNFGGTPTPPAN